MRHYKYLNFIELQLIILVIDSLPLDGTEEIDNFSLDLQSGISSILPIQNSNLILVSQLGEGFSGLI